MAPPDLDELAIFPSCEEARAACKKDHRPRVFAKHTQAAPSTYGAQDGWGICDRGEWLEWAQLPYSAYALSDELPSVARELAEIWEVSVDDFVHAYTEGADLRMLIEYE